MWSKRDWVRMMVVAVGACGVTVAGFSAKGLTAQEKAVPVAVKIPRPTLKIGNCSVWAAPVKNDQVLEVKDGRATVAVDSIPRLQLFLENAGESEETMSFKASMAVQSVMDSFSRVPRSSSPGWIQEYTITLKAGEKKVIDAEPGLMLTGGNSATVMLQSAGRQGAAAAIYALSMTTPQAIPTGMIVPRGLLGMADVMTPQSIAESGTGMTVFSGAGRLVPSDLPGVVRLRVIAGSGTSRFTAAVAGFATAMPVVAAR